jgi:hypothetical protein
MEIPPVRVTIHFRTGGSEEGILFTNVIEYGDHDKVHDKVQLWVKFDNEDVDAMWAIDERIEPESMRVLYAPRVGGVSCF